MSLERQAEARFQSLTCHVKGPYTLFGSDTKPLKLFTQGGTELDLHNEKISMCNYLINLFFFNVPQ